MNIIVMGAGGRMGRALIQAVAQVKDAILVGAIERPESSLLGADAGELASVGKLGVKVTDQLDAILSAGDIVIDFTSPEATLNNLAIAKKIGARLVIGTTGFTSEHLATINGYSDSISFVIAGNYSVGVNLSLQLLRTAARVMGESADVEVIEAHHRHKVDAPSGTALMMGQAAAEGLGITLDEVAVYAREGITGARKPGSIGFSAIRGGDIVGEHTVMFAADGERLEITHKASSRQTFAQGAVRAAKWLSEAPNKGQFTMEHVLGFTKV